VISIASPLALPVARDTPNASISGPRARTLNGSKPLIME
jgi:hypothetical protein